jgi:hypothetical protein
VDKLLRPQADVEAFNRRCDESENAAAGSIEGLRAWWLRRMMETPHPLLEKMTLFWHGYFAVNATAVNNPQLMKEHVRLLRRHALGSFGSLLPAIARDPTMLVWLGAEVNRKATPNDGSSGPSWRRSRWARVISLKRMFEGRPARSRAGSCCGGSFAICPRNTMRPSKAFSAARAISPPRT